MVTVGIQAVFDIIYRPKPLFRPIAQSVTGKCLSPVHLKSKAMCYYHTSVTVHQIRHSWMGTAFRSICCNACLTAGVRTLVGFSGVTLCPLGLW